MYMLQHLYNLKKDIKSTLEKDWYERTCILMSILNADAITKPPTPEKMALTLKTIRRSNVSFFRENNNIEDIRPSAPDFDQQLFFENLNTFERPDISVQEIQKETTQKLTEKQVFDQSTQTKLKKDMFAPDAGEIVPDLQTHPIEHMDYLFKKEKKYQEAAYYKRINGYNKNPELVPDPMNNTRHWLEYMQNKTMKEKKVADEAKHKKYLEYLKSDKYKEGLKKSLKAERKRDLARLRRNKAYRNRDRDVNSGDDYFCSKWYHVRGL